MKRSLQSIPSLLLPFVCTLFCLPAEAQRTPQQVLQMKKKLLGDQNISYVKFSEETQTPALIKLHAAGLAYNDTEIKTTLSKYLELRSGVDNIVQNKKSSLPGNINVLEYQQYFKSIKVDRAGYKAFLKDSRLGFLAGAFYDVPNGLVTTPVLTELQALNFAKKQVNAKKYAWEQLEEDLAKSPTTINKKLLKNELSNYLPKGELVIIKDFTNTGTAKMRLAYKFNIYAAVPLSRAWVYVDAQNGKILLYDKIIKHVGDPSPDKVASSNATVQTRYAGSQVIKTKQISGNDPNSGAPLISSHPSSELTYVPGASTYVLIDDTRGKGIETYDLNNVGGIPLNVSALYMQGKSFTDIDNNWTLAQHHRSPQNEGAFEAENDDIAWDAHWGAEVVYDYWLAKHNRLSYDGKNAKIFNFIHYGPAYDNAFWNGTAMTYGDGSGTAASGFKALTSLDVCGHEIGHGVCSSTADLIYQGESGAMNEGFSDIWAACTEYFSMTRSGSTVPSTAFRPFYIGEQIGANYDAPLRRMDNTKQQGNPDTYGGTNWVNPTCAPNAVNDQCGVHTNSGVLNKWFFLITAGSKNGTRPAGFTTNQYYFADSDDEINDQGETYKINGLGFTAAENLTFITETMLTSAATYAEARDVSIQVATTLSGDACSALVETVTNAWYAVGVGNKFVKPCSLTYGFAVKPGITVNEASLPSGCSSAKTYSVPVLLPGKSTASISYSGTAKSGVDYTVSPSALSNTGSSDSRQSVSVSIKNDGVVEADETLVLTMALTNAGSKTVNKTYTFTIMDDDAAPVIGAGEKTLLNQTFTRTDGFTDPSGWSERLEVPETNGDPMATGKNQWGVFDNKLAITGKEGLTNTQLPKGTYNSNSQSQTVIKSPLIDARGLSLINVKFDYEVQGEVDVAQGSADIENLPVFDYMAVAYSFDGVTFVELNSSGFKQFASALPASGMVTADLPASLSNKQFYLAFRWSNDGNAGGPKSVSIDNLLIKGAPRQIENTLNRVGNENLRPGEEVYFYSTADAEILGKVKNTSTNDFGCTGISLIKVGNSSYTLYSNSSSKEKVSSKIIKISPSASYVAASTVTLYFMEAQLAALESATGKSRNTFMVYQVSLPSITQASASNTKKYAAVYTPISGVGGYYTVSFNDKLGAFYTVGVNVPNASLSRPALVENKGIFTKEGSDWKVGNIYPNPGSAEAIVNIAVPSRQQVKIELLNLSGQVMQTQTKWLLPGASQIKLRVDKYTTGKYLLNLRNNDGKIINTQSYIKK